VVIVAFVLAFPSRSLRRRLLLCPECLAVPLLRPIGADGE